MSLEILQHLVDGMSKEWQKERASSQMTLGKLIERLQAMPPDAMVDKLCGPHSYRGYCEDLAFEEGNGQMPANELLKVANGCMGKMFEGYKGGEFVMGERTPVWMSMYRCCGKKIMDIDELGHFVLADGL